MSSKNLLVLFMIGLMAFSIGCGSDDDGDNEPTVSSRAYKGHENDIDISNLVNTYPSIVGTRLDDCQTCHTGAIENGALVSSSCDHCHALMLEEQGHTFAETLNAYGMAYMEAGRSLDALSDIADLDSDGDGSSNSDEITELRYPGSDQSQPGQAIAALRVVTVDELKAMPDHSQFMLANANKQQFDDYVTYRGVRIKDLFEQLGIDLTGAVGVTVIAPDGYMKSLPIEDVDRVFPPSQFYSGLGVATLGEECGFVNYPELVPDGLTHGNDVPGEHWLIMAYERDGVPLVASYLDVTNGTIEGEGPLRIVVPQSEPGAPDRGLKYSPSGCDDGYDFSDNADHNAGAMVRGVVAIRIDPMPAGVEEFDYTNGGWAYIDANELIIYGHNVQ